MYYVTRILHIVQLKIAATKFMFFFNKMGTVSDNIPNILMN